MLTACLAFSPSCLIIWSSHFSSIKMEHYMTGPAHNYIKDEDGWTIRCNVCKKVADESHCLSRGHLHNMAWMPQYLTATAPRGHPQPRMHQPEPEPKHNATACSSSITEHFDGHYNQIYYHCALASRSWWTTPPAWYPQWLADVTQCGILNPTIIFNVCGALA